MLLVCRLLLAGVFIVAGLAKLTDLSGTGVALEEFGAPASVSRVVACALPLAEVAVAVAGAAALGAGLAGGGLPVGSAAPDFELETLDGTRGSLSGLTSDERLLVPVFGREENAVKADRAVDQS